MELEEAKNIIEMMVYDILEDKDFEEAWETVTAEVFAMQNLLDEKNEELDRLQKENEELKEKNKLLQENYTTCFEHLNWCLANYIHKDKIRELIENETIDISGFECVAVEDLQGLLKEE